MPVDLHELDIELRPPAFNAGGFDCGKEDMNEYLRGSDPSGTDPDGTDAARDAIANVSKTYVVRHSGQLVAYLTLLADAIRLQAKERPTGIPYPTAPALKIGRIAVDKRYQRQRIGEYLLIYVVGHARRISGEVGCRYVTLDSHADKVRWYQEFGFVSNDGETAARKAVRFVLSHIGREKELPNVSMRYDLFLPGDHPNAHV